MTAEYAIYTTSLVARELSRVLLGPRPSTVFEYCGFCSSCCSNAASAAAAAASSCKVLGRSTRALLGLLANTAQAYTLSAVFFVNVVQNSIPAFIFLSGRRNRSQSDQTGNSFLRIRAQVLIFQTMCTWRRATWYVRVSLSCITMNEENQHLAKAAWAPAPAKPSQT